LCLGSPASYQQVSLDDITLVIAKAESIEYLLINDIINLKTNASLARNGTFIKGDTINYDLAKGTWKAKGDDQSDQKRIQLVIPPFKQTGTAMDEPVRTGVSLENLEETS
jgi:lipopolysaccharide export system protein LptA